MNPIIMLFIDTFFDMLSSTKSDFEISICDKLEEFYMVAGKDL